MTRYAAFLRGVNVGGVKLTMPDVARTLEQAGFTEFLDRDGQRIFPHTEVDEKFEGRGLGTILVRQALEATRDAGLRIVPVCPMVAAFIDKNTEFGDIADPVTDEAKQVASQR